MATSLQARRHEEATDAQLLERVARGELASLGVLYDRHHEAVRHFVARATGDAPDTDDITQEVFLALSNIAERFDGRASARPLLVGIAAKLVRQRRRGVARLLQVLGEFATSGFERQVKSPEETATVTEQMERFERAFARLSEEKRLVVLLVDGEGMKGEEAAKVLGIPLNTVWTRLHYARKELREGLAREIARPRR